MLQVSVCESLQIKFILAFLAVLWPVNLYPFEETCTSLELPVYSSHTEFC